MIIIIIVDCLGLFVHLFLARLYSCVFVSFLEEYAQFYGAMNTMNGRMVTMRKDGLPYEEMGYVPPPNRFLSLADHHLCLFYVL